MACFTHNILKALKKLGKNASFNHVIKIKHDLDDKSLKVIEPIVEKRNLKIEKLEDALIIY